LNRARLLPQPLTLVGFNYFVCSEREKGSSAVVVWKLSWEVRKVKRPQMTPGKRYGGEVLTQT